MGHRPARCAETGFTLVEVMTVVGILGVMMALAVGGWQNAKRSGSLQTSALTLQANLGVAAGRAVERGADVWVIVYTDINTKGEAGKGGGGYFLFEDRRFNFLSSTVGAGEINYDDFDPPNSMKGDNGVLLESVYLDYGNTRFHGTGTETFPEPFATLSLSSAASKACSFCSSEGGKMRGAIVFNSEGTARFYDGDGTQVQASASTAPGRAAALLLYPPTGTDRRFQFAVSGPTGFVGFYPGPKP